MMTAIDRQHTGSHRIDTTLNDWQETGAPGFWLKPIFKDSQTGVSTALMKIDPGAYTPDHAHDQLEEIYVLDGDFYDAEHSYGPGHYCQRAIGAMHEAGSKGGCTMLLMYRR
jgi:anti-sigma factor ChrR (cupin superfamily)